MIWGPLIAWYLFLAGLSAGMFVATAYIGRTYPKTGKTCLFGRIVAFVALCVGLVFLMVDAEAGLSDPGRFFLLFGNPASVMTIGVYIICLYMVVLVASIVLDVMKKAQPRILAAVGCVLALCLAAYTGFLLGAATPYPLWSNAALPVLFVVSAASAGLAAVLIIGRIVNAGQVARMHELGRTGVALPLVEAFVLFCMLVSVASGSADGAASVASLVSGAHALAFMGGVVVLGLVMPFVIELVQTRRKASSAVLGYLADAGVLVGGFCLRYAVVAAAVFTLCV